MARLRNKNTGTLIDVSDDLAARLGSEWAAEGKRSAPEPDHEEPENVPFKRHRRREHQ